MRLFKPGPVNREGSVLMVTLFSAVLIGTVLASYLTLIRHQSAAVARSQGWNAALAMAEAGVEEALAQINSGNFNANGWGPFAGTSSTLKSRTFPLMNGGYDVRFFVTTPTNQTILSTGYVTIPSLSVTVSRSVKVTTKVAPVLNTGGIAVGAKGSISFLSNYGGLATDSFDSADPANKGRYPISDPSRQLTNGDIGTVSGPITLGSGPNIKGDLFLGPTVTAPATPPGSMVGQVHRDFNSDYPDVDAPVNAAYWTQAALDGAGKYTFSGVAQNIITDGSAAIVVRAGADVTLYVTASNFKPSAITIETNSLGSGKLKIYQPSGTATFPGSGKTSVQSERPENLQYFGMSGVTCVTNAGNYNFFGVLYAPSADLFLDGGWNSSPYTWYDRMNFVGAAVGKSIKMYGYYTFHFDENLLRPGVTGGGSMTSLSYVADAWKENL